MLPWLDSNQFAQVCSLSDLFLDSIGFSGCVTVLDAIEQSLPIVTARGTMMRGRQAAGILNILGLNELIAENANDYFSIALQLAQDPEYRQMIREKITKSKEKLYADIS